MSKHIELRPLLQECREHTLGLCEMFDKNQIDYVTFLDHTRVKVRFMKKYLERSTDFEEANRVREVLQEHASVVSYQTQLRLQFV